MADPCLSFAAVTSNLVRSISFLRGHGGSFLLAASYPCDLESVIFKGKILKLFLFQKCYTALNVHLAKNDLPKLKTANFMEWEFCISHLFTETFRLLSTSVEKT